MSEQTEVGGRGSGTDREIGIGFDVAIDRAVREMLDVEPPPGLRGRVLDGIELSSNSVASAFRRKIFWIAAPVAAAAILVLAVLLPSKTPTTVVDPERTVATTPLRPRSPAGSPSRRRARRRSHHCARAASGRRRADGHAAAADAAGRPRRGRRRNDRRRPTSCGSIPSPRRRRWRAGDRAGTRQTPFSPSTLHRAEIPALEIRPISDTPRERRNQE